MKINAQKLAKFILTTYKDVPISPMKLQKLAYYAKVWSVVANRDFIAADFEKWDFGPVNKDIYREYKKYARKVIPIPNENITFGNEKEDFIKFVLQSYVEKSAVSLSIQTHKEKPWSDTPRNAIISNDAIRSYYSKQNFAKNFQRKNYNDPPFFVLKTNTWHSFTMDMDSKEASFYETYPSHEEFIKRTQKAKSAFNKFLKKRRLSDVH